MNPSELSDADYAGTVQASDRDDGGIVIHEGAPGWAAGQIQGRREEQQDSYGWALEPSYQFALADQLLLIVADGMGGHAGGATASRTVVESFGREYCETHRALSYRLEDALSYANRRLASAVREDRDHAGTGTTLVAAHLAGRRLRWLSVGDSPLWLVSARQDSPARRLIRLNQDHSMKPVLEQLAEFGRLTAEEAAADPRRHELRSVVMGDEVPLMELREAAVELAVDDVVLVATDGIETLAAAEIVDLVDANRSSPRAVVEALLAAVRAEARPDQDNATVMACKPIAATG